MASALLYCRLWDSVPAFWVKLGANDLNCVDVLTVLNPTHSLATASFFQARRASCCSANSVKELKEKQTIQYVVKLRIDAQNLRCKHNQNRFQFYA